MLPALQLPKVRALVEDKHIKLYLRDCKVIMAQSGTIMLVSLTFGAGYYGRFRGTEFYPARDCKQEYLDQLQDVENRGIEAVREIGILTGSCCICGRTLTAEESISDGIGPICAGKAFGIALPKKSAAKAFNPNALDLF